MAGLGNIDVTSTDEEDLESSPVDDDPTHRYDAAMWLRKRVGVVAARDLPAEPSEEDFRQGLRSGMILCNVANKIQSGSVPKVVDAPSPVFNVPDAAAQTAYLENIKSFLTAMDGMGIPTFDPNDVEQGGEFARVVDSVLALKAYSEWKGVGGNDSDTFTWTPKCSPRKKTFSRRHSEPVMSLFSRTQSVSSDQSFDESDLFEEGDSGPLYTIVCDLLEDREEEDIPLIIENILNKLKEEFQSKLEEKTKKVTTGTTEMSDNDDDEDDDDDGDDDDDDDYDYDDDESSTDNEKKEEVLRKIKRDDEIAREQERLDREKELEAQKEMARKKEEDEKAAKEQERINREKELEAEKERARKEEEEKARKEQERINQEKELETQKERAIRQEEEEKARKEQERINQEKELEAQKERARKHEEEEKARKEQERIKQEKELEAQKERARKQEEKARHAQEREILKREKQLQRQIERAKKMQDAQMLAKEQARIQREQEYLEQLEKEKQEDEEEEEKIRLEEKRERQQEEEERARQEEEERAAIEQERLEREQELLEEQERAKKKEEYSKRMDQYNTLNANTANRKALIDKLFKDLEELKSTIPAVKSEVQLMKDSYLEEDDSIGRNVRTLCQAAAGYKKVLEENRKLYNQVQDLKGSVRVYCRVRPLLPAEENRPTSVDYMDNETVTIIAPSKSGREGRRASMFNKVFGPSSTQEEVFSDTQPLICSVLDGFNVCIFAYGQTGAGKTYTLMGPDDLTSETMGVGYRALNDLFLISEERKNLMAYEISINMLEVYNDEIRDLLVTDGSNKIVDVVTGGKKGINVPDANRVPVTSTDEVISQMNICRKNRAVNDHSTRSHSFLTVHVFGKDLTAGTTVRGCMHLVDLAGSENLDNSDDETTHIKKSLSSLGDVLVALANKSSKVNYKNCKLTQLLQDALGAQAKILMFVHVHPAGDEGGETLNTFKSIERFSMVDKSVEVRELKEKIALLKAALAKKEARDPNWQELLDDDGEDDSKAKQASKAAPSAKKPAAAAAAAPKASKPQTAVDSKKKKGK